MERIKVRTKQKVKENKEKSQKNLNVYTLHTQIPFFVPHLSQSSLSGEHAGEHAGKHNSKMSS